MCLRLHGLPGRTGRSVPGPRLDAPSRARTLGVDFVGIEIDEHYLEEAIARVRALWIDRAARQCAGLKA